jgi:nicotinate-nucleotide pyrophosphorylase (carboxylating)
MAEFPMPESVLASCIRRNVTESLEEDIHTGDLSARLLPEALTSTAQILTRQNGVLCGTQWFEECFLTLDPGCAIDWMAKDGNRISAGQTLCEVRGRARALLSAERNALNWLQTLSGTATRTRQYVDAVVGISVKIMDTRKTLPGLRQAQKYAVRTGGGHNQRIGLYDGILIKENHIAAAGGIRPVLEQAFRLARPGISVQIEVENMAQLDEALNAGAKLILLDNFGLDELRAAVRHTGNRAELEASGGITLDNLREIALTGVGRISIGSLTKDVQTIDLSMRFKM